MLYEAAHVADEGRLSHESIRQDPYLASYAKDWGRPGDLGIVAYVLGDGEAVGAAWVRRLVVTDGDEHLDGGHMPELAIGVIPVHRRQGVGTALLTLLLDAARDRVPGITLTVRDNNPAFNLYKRMGFQVVAGPVINRVGGRSTKMCLVWK